MLKIIYIGITILTFVYFWLISCDAEFRLKQKHKGIDSEEFKKEYKQSKARIVYGVLSIVLICIIPILHAIYLVILMCEYDSMVQETVKNLENQRGLLDDRSEDAE